MIKKKVKKKAKTVAGLPKLKARTIVLKKKKISSKTKKKLTGIKLQIASKKMAPVWLWVYYKKETSALNAALKGLECTGSGCCTDDYDDASYEVKSEAKAISLAKKIIKLPGVGWCSIQYVTSNKPSVSYPSKSLPASIRKHLRNVKK